MDHADVVCADVPSTQFIDVEIPEPDYDDDNENDDVIQSDVVASSAGGKYRELELPTAGRMPKSDFQVVRTKMETFSREEFALTASYAPEPVADEPCLPDIPEPDYPDYDEDDCCDAGSAGVSSTAAAAAVSLDDDQRTPARMIYSSPVSKEMQAVQRELAFNQKQGVNVLGKKSELAVEMDKRKLRQRQRDEEERRRQTRSIFEQRLEEQAQKVALAEQRDSNQLLPATDDEKQAEFLRVRSRISKVKEVC